MVNILTTNLIDTNILVYANNKDSTFHTVCKSIVEKAINGEISTVIAVQNLIELYAVITEKRKVERPLSPIKAKELIEIYRKSNIRVITSMPQSIDTVTMLTGK